MDGPTVIIGALIFAIVILVFQTNGKNKKVDRTKAAFMRVKSQAIDKLKEYSVEDVKRISEDKNTRDYKELNNLIFEFEEFCIAFSEDKFNKRALYDLCRGHLSDELHEKMNIMSEQTENVDEVFQWFKAENKYHNMDTSSSAMHTKN